ncbi:MAG: hypothetical protein M1814_001936 [Vezdaea aestivalis]|nr:MAG: hypothetical protein M1814_001936 [Vezdaea aestivalis]
MSDDEADPELLALLRQSLGLGGPAEDAPPDTKVLQGAEYVYNNAIDVAIDWQHTRAAAAIILDLMQKKQFSTKSWSQHELHPQIKDEDALNFIFTMDLLNFSFWSENDSSSRFAIEYNGKTWTGYWSLVAALRRALDDGIPITDSHFWQNEAEFTEDVLRHVFRSSTDECIPLIEERLSNLREAGQILYEKYDCRFANCVKAAGGSAAGLVNLIADDFDCFRDETRFEGKKIRILKRAQILVADIWACFEGDDFGLFNDIDKITMFADLGASGINLLIRFVGQSIA